MVDVDGVFKTYFVADPICHGKAGNRAGYG